MSERQGRNAMKVGFRFSVNEKSLSGLITLALPSRQGGSQWPAHPYFIGEDVFDGTIL
jgi:hypothetical protein